MQKSFLNKIIFSLGIFFAFSLVTNQAQAAVLLPGNISTCGELAVSGTYTLTTNITGATTTCFKVTSNSVIIDGANHTVTATGTVTAYAITATSTANGGSAFGTTTVQNITFVNFSNGIDTRGNDRNSEADQVPGGNGGGLAISTSTLGSIITSGGVGASGGTCSEDCSDSYDAGSGGNAGNIVVTNSNIATTTGSGGSSGYANYSAGYPASYGLGANVTITNSIIYSIVDNGLGGSSIVLNNSTTTSSIDGNGGSIYYRGGGSNITLINSYVGGFISVNSTDGSYSSGLINLDNSTVFGNINSTNPGNGGGVGTTTITNSITGSVSVYNPNRSLGTIIISGTNVNLSNNTYSAHTLNVSYATSTGSLTTSGTTLSALTNLIFNGANYGTYPGGPWPSFPDPSGTTLINTCQEFVFAGTYLLTQDITNVPGVCFTVKGNGIIIDGAGHTVTSAGGNTAYAITATSTTNGGSAFGTTTVQNITISGFGGGIDARGNTSSTTPTAIKGGNGGNVVVSSSTLTTVISSGGNSSNTTGSSLCSSGTNFGGRGANITINNSTTTALSSLGGRGANANTTTARGCTGGSGGVITINNSTTGIIDVSGGNGGNGGSGTKARGDGGNGGSIYINNTDKTGSLTASGGNRGTVGSATGNGGNGGSIYLSGDNLFFTNKTISVEEGLANDTGTQIQGTTTLTYTGDVDFSGSTFVSDLSTLIVNNTNIGAYSAGNFPFFPGNVDACGKLVGSGTYTLTQDIITASDTCFEVLADNVIFNGNNHSITGTSGNSGSIGFRPSLGSISFGTTTLQNLTLSGFGRSIYTQTFYTCLDDSGSVVIQDSNVTGGVVTTVCGDDKKPGNFQLINSTLNGYFYGSTNYGTSVLIDNSTLNGGLQINNNITSTILGLIQVLDSTITGYLSSSGGSGNSGPNIHIATSTVTDVINNGGPGLFGYNSSGVHGGNGGSGGTTTIINSRIGTITSSGGLAGGISVFCDDGCDNLQPNTFSGDGGNGGFIDIVSSVVTGAITANGGSDIFQEYYGRQLLPGNGGNGGTVLISESSVLSTTTASGSNARGNGGNGGTFTLTYATSTILTAKGGNSTACGNGGLGGTINISNDSVYSSYDISGGDGSNSGCLSETKSSGYAGQRVVFTAPARTINTVTAATSAPRSTGAILRNLNPFGKTNLIPLPAINFFGPDGGIFNPKKVGSTIIPYPFKDFKLTSPFVLTPSPDFKINVSNFLFSPLPSTISAALKEASKLQNFIAAAGLNKEQDLAKIANNPLVLNTSDEVPPGHFVIKSGEQNLKTYVTYDKSVGGLAELAKVSPNQSITISLIPLSLGNVVASYLDQQITFEKASDFAVAYITTPTEPGRYVLKTSSSPIPLLLEVVAPPKIEEPVVKPWGVFNFIWKLFNK